MSDNSGNSSHKLPLLEAVVAIVLLAVLSVPIVKLYVSADKSQTKAAEVRSATVRAEEIAELTWSEQYTLSGDRLIFTGDDGETVTFPTEGSLESYWTAKWKEAPDRGKAKYRMVLTGSVTQGKTSQCFNVNIEIFNLSDELLVSLRHASVLR